MMNTYQASVKVRANNGLSQVARTEVQAPALESNFWDFKVQCPFMESNFEIFQFECWLCRRMSEAKFQLINQLKKRIKDGTF